MQIGLVKIDQKALNAMPESERRAFFAFGFLANEIIYLQKLLHWCVTATECSDGVECEARTSLIFFFLRIQIGKLREAHQTLEKFYFSGLSKKYHARLDPSVRDGLKHFKRTLNKKQTNDHPFNQIRDKVSFHADDDILYANAFSRIPDNADFRIYMHQTRINWFFQYADIGTIGIIMEITGKNGGDSLTFCFCESIRLSRMLLNFIENWMCLVLQERFDVDPSLIEQMTLSNLMRDDAVAIPFFTEPPEDETAVKLMPLTIRFPASAQWASERKSDPGE